MQTLRLLVVNVNTSGSITARLVAAAEAFFEDRASVTGLTAGFGSPYIASRSAVAVAGHAALDAVENATISRSDYDACVLACFGDPGLEALREACPFPCIGMAEASVVTALQVGQRFAIVTAGERWPGILAEFLRAKGYAERCAGIIDVPGDGLDLVAERTRALDLVSGAVDTAVRHCKADVVIIGGAALQDLAAELQASSPVPLIDSVRAAWSQAEALARLRPIAATSTTSVFSAPAEGGKITTVHAPP